MLKNLFISAVVACALVFVSGICEAKSKKGEDGGKNDKEYWCKKGGGLRKQLDAAKADIEKRENRIEELAESAGKETGSARKNLLNKTKKEKTELAAIRKKQRQAQAKLDDLEEKAHRKGVPPGWLRCQFE
ncbi:MAG: hypothetical protein EPN22_13165 [Nitrospirae bacterium]|nr:MAG: hypothetical protein EPN22_13165 [Nitrospirota bacterium]